MKTKIFLKELELNNTPLERLVFDSINIGERYILLDDVNENRWKIVFKVCLAIKITGMDYAGLNFFKGGDFEDGCFEDKEGFPVPQFRGYIMEVENSKWIKELKKTLRKGSDGANCLEKAKHFLIPCYDDVIEIIAWNLELEKME